MSVDVLLKMPLQDAPSTQALFAFAQGLAMQQGCALRPPPPEPTTCCGRGCNGCVWEGFFAAAMFWRDDAVIALRQTVGH